MQPHKPEWFERSLRYVFAVYAAVLISLVGGTVLLAWLLSTPLERAFFVVFGIFTIAGAYWKPWWYWEHIDGWLARRMLGDRVARIVFLIVGLALLYAGLFVNLPG
jgi:hypothetical protein